ncbi:MAG: non-homologous end-joining DNA ligase [Dehalococcoidia bacterium]|jgi:bifunctional non-homologous end joining protein LigD
MADKMRIGDYTIELSNTDKVLFPLHEITKGDLIDYYHKIAKVMLPYLKGRPITMHRFPDGIDGEGFYQQDISDYFPDWIERTTVKKEGGRVTHVICQNAATLVYLANQACITPHAWLSRKDRLNHPDLMIFDLDPPADDFEPVRHAAQLLKKFLDELGIESFVKTTGSKGLHVVVPLDKSVDFEEGRGFARSVAIALAEREPAKLTTEQRKEKRKGRVFLDYLRNSYGQTAVAPYAVRAKQGAPIAVPIEWDELGDRNLMSQSYNTKNIFRRLSQKKDPWEGIWRKANSVDKAKQRIRDIGKQVT